ncbi:hypothetical protein KI387_026576, partial [Taxus chinensis]
MGSLKSTKSHAIITRKENPRASKDKKLNLQKKDKPQNNSSPNQNSKERIKCGYCHGMHNEEKCLKKKISLLTDLLEKHNIGVPDSLKTPSSSHDSYKEKE